MSIWRNFERIVDGIVDGYFAEPIEIHPMAGEEDVTGAPQADPDRNVLYCIGMYVVPGAAATGESGSLASGRSNVGGPMLTSQEWVSITEDQLGSPAKWGPAVSNFDRVYLPERDTWHTINSITPSATGRYNVMLTRLQEPR